MKKLNRGSIYLIVIICLLCSFSVPIWSQGASLESLQNQMKELQNQNTKWDLRDIVAYMAFVVSGLVLWRAFYLKKSAELELEKGVAKIGVRLTKLEAEAEQRILQVEKSIIRTINEKDTTIQLVMDKTNIEHVLLQTKRIRIWGEVNNESLRTVLRIVGFNLKNLISEEDISMEYDILFINNEKGNLSPEKQLENKSDRPSRDFLKINKIIKEQAPTICIFYYNTNQAHLPMDTFNLSEKLRINFATNPSQIYGNLLNTLKYQEKLSQNLSY